MTYTYLYSVLLGIFIISFIPVIAQEYPYTTSTEKGTLYVGISPEFVSDNSNEVKIKIDFINPTTNSIQEHIDYKLSLNKDNENIFGPIPLTHTSTGSVNIPMEIPKEGKYTLELEVEGILFQPIPKESASVELVLDKNANQMKTKDKNVVSRDCLIATASYDSELSPQVQMLREIRDKTLLATESGTKFMNGFNSVYYLFSPTIAQWEKENPLFKETVKLFITPMIAMLSIMTLADNSEIQIILYGISTLGLIFGFYLVMPIIVTWKIKKRI